MSNHNAIKQSLLTFCKSQVDARFKKVHDTIAGIVASLDDASKSSAGDKHETSRAMLQIERENAGKQLLELEKLSAIIAKTNIDNTAKNIHLGSLVYTEKANYFICVSQGATVIDGATFYCISLQTPIGQLLAGKTEGDCFNFGGETYAIEEVV